jgi:hypothetical protein
MADGSARQGLGVGEFRDLSFVMLLACRKLSFPLVSASQIYRFEILKQFRMTHYKHANLRISM